MPNLSSITKRVPLASIHHDPANVRTHGERNLEAIANSLRSFGQVEPLIVQKSTGKVIGGNGRLTAMQSLGWAEADVVELDIDDTRATALGIALNRTAELAEWDDAGLAALLQSLPTDAQLAAGWDDGELAALLEDIKPADPLPIDHQSPIEIVWALVGVPVNQWGQINQVIEGLAEVEGAIVKTSVQ